MFDFVMHKLIKMKTPHFIFLLIVFSTFSCGIFKTADQKTDSKLLGRWELISAEKDPAYQKKDTKAEINTVITKAYRLNFELLADSSYIKTSEAGKEKGLKKVSNEGQHLHLGSEEFQIIRIDENELLLKKGQYIFTFKRS